MSGGLIINASLRSPATAIGLLAICLFWNGIVSVFVLVLASQLYTKYVGPLPTWFPAPTIDKTTISNGTTGGLVFECLFMVPFILVGLFLIVFFFTALMGRVELKIEAGQGKVRTGIGPFSWSKKFDASKIQQVSAGLSTYQVNDKSQPLIQIKTPDRTVKFGSTLTQPRREWMLALLHILLVSPNKSALSKLGLRPTSR